MLQTACPKLRAIAKLLREKDDLQFAMIVRNAPDAELRRAQGEAFRINRLMTNHRRKCFLCTPTLALMTPRRTKPPLLEMVS
jgi:hypothetical protein